MTVRADEYRKSSQLKKNIHFVQHHMYRENEIGRKESRECLTIVFIIRCTNLLINNTCVPHGPTWVNKQTNKLEHTNKHVPYELFIIVNRFKNARNCGRPFIKWYSRQFFNSLIFIIIMFYHILVYPGIQHTLEAKKICFNYNLTLKTCNTNTRQAAQRKVLCIHIGLRPHVPRLANYWHFSLFFFFTFAKSDRARRWILEKQSTEKKKFTLDNITCIGKMK